MSRDKNEVVTALEVVADVFQTMSIPYPCRVLLHCTATSAATSQVHNGTHSNRNIGRPRKFARQSGVSGSRSACLEFLNLTSIGQEFQAAWRLSSFLGTSFLNWRLMACLNGLGLGSQHHRSSFYRVSQTLDDLRPFCACSMYLPANGWC